MTVVVAVVLILVVVAFAGACGYAGDAFDCQLRNKGSEWFDGYQYRMCTDAQARSRREWAEHEREQEACRKGNARACFGAGMVDVPVDEGVARGELETACRADIAEACWRVGTLMYGDFSVFLPRHRARALALFVRACDLGEARGCADVGRVHPDEPTRSARSSLGRTFCAPQLCAEVAKLRIQRRTPGDIVELRAAVAATCAFDAGSPDPEPDPPPSSPRSGRETPPLSRALATRAADSKGIRGDARWRRRESNTACEISGNRYRVAT